MRCQQLWNIVSLSLQTADRYHELALVVGDYVCVLCPQQHLPQLSVSRVLCVCMLGCVCVCVCEGVCV